VDWERFEFEVEFEGEEVEETEGDGDNGLTTEETEPNGDAQRLNNCVLRIQPPLQFLRASDCLAANCQ
jgi:hypothetical protein